MLIIFPTLCIVLRKQILDIVLTGTEIHYLIQYIINALCKTSTLEYVI